MNFPKTIILSINTHGGIDCLENKSSNKMELNYIYPVIKVPTNIKKLIIINSVPFGIDINITNLENENYINTIKKFYHEQNTNINELSLNQINIINEKIIEQIKNKTIEKIKNKIILNKIIDNKN